ncbi:TIP120-domain-containing protein [Suhomyces tanzawaensis NRRL Y-17324]|uniref:TIP120-domain-containing protein n=1 Tax=Suhomyces tanzawaensis NRRL Y-17324 TaxID=984487 RepID=A0A1E4SK89_9ASCO|nr:TIP120-domain-containing protein [Suhomyces tanzawaensis NRRL Y-17324]ODV79842.1 TIP120-domain-containing protein [Suhomyces tanzawaensis NRRL Y-17324]
MQDINLKVLIDKALDVDPDLRFMALEDYRKYLESSKPQPSNLGGYNAIEGFIPTLFRLLQDHNSDVQSQAIKSFAPTVRYLSNEATLKVIDQLYTLILQENAKSRDKGQFKSFTTSIPNMALRSIFDTTNEHPEGQEDSKKTRSNSKFDAKLARAIINKLLPQLIKNDITYDSIEILIDLIKNLGSSLTSDELYNLSLFLIEISFKEAGIISKRSIHGFSLLFKHVVREQDLNNSIRSIHNHDLKQGSRDTIIIKSQLYSVLMSSPLLIEAELLSEIFKEISLNLKLSQELNHDEDLDYDRLLEDNLIREDSLFVLNNLVKSNNDISNFENEIFKIIKFFITYNPLFHEDDDDEMLDMDDDDKDIEFSDEENEADGDDDDDGSWKLRMRSSILIRSFLNKFPSSIDLIYLGIFNQIPIDDRNELVFNEAIKAVIFIIDNTLERRDESFQFIEKKIVDKLLVNTQHNQLPKVLKLIESLNRFDEKALVETTFSKFKQLQLVTDGSLHYLNFYRNVLEVSAKQDSLSDPIVEYIAGDLVKSLDNKSFNVIIESIKISNMLYKNANRGKITKSQIELIVNSLVTKVENNKVYSSDLVQLSIQSLGELLLNNLYSDYAKLIKVFKKSICGETTVRVTLETLIQLSSVNHEIFDADDFQHNLLERLNELIVSRDESIQNLAMSLLVHLLNKAKFDVNADSGLVGNLITVLTTSDSSALNDSDNVFEILTTLYSKTAFSLEDTNLIISSIITLVNSEKIQRNNQWFNSLISNLAHDNPVIYERFKLELNLGNQVSSKILAIVCVENNLHDQVAQYEELLLRLIENKSSRSPTSSELAFSIQFLGNVGESRPLEKVNITHLLQLVDETKLNHEDAVKKTAATAIGRLVKYSVSEQFENLMDYYQQPSFERSRSYLVQSFKVFLNELDEAHLDTLWKQVWLVLRTLEFDHSLCGELRNSGDLLSEIALRKESYINEIIANSENELSNVDSSSSLVSTSLVYTTIVISKKLLNKLQPSESNSIILKSLVSLSIKWLAILNIDIKQLIIGNLLTGLHSQPSLILENLKVLILPSVFDQLKAKPEFKKTIPMGPYKFVIDEGLEIRKLCYEFLYTLISLDSSELKGSTIDLYEILVNIINQGLVDEQNDIIVLACLNLINFVTSHESFFRSLILLNDGDLSTKIITNVQVQLNKKLSAKASSQDVESYEEKIKSIVKLSKQVYQIVHSYDGLQDQKIPLEWNELIMDIKGRFPTFYNALD